MISALQDYKELRKLLSNIAPEGKPAFPSATSLVFDTVYKQTRAKLSSNVVVVTCDSLVVCPAIVLH